MKPQVGQKIVYEGRSYTVYNVYQFGTIDVVDDNENYFRITGLNWI